MNPQKVRLAQVLERRRIQEKKEKAKKVKPKSRKKNETNRELYIKASMETAKPSDDTTATEFSPDEFDDEKFQSIKNELLRNLMLENLKLDKYLKILAENEKKLKMMEESVIKWFDRYEEMLRGFEEQMNFYDQGREENMQQLLLEVEPLAHRWKELINRLEKMKEVKNFSSFLNYAHSLSIYEHCLHYGILATRKILYTFAVIRDYVFPGNRNEKMETASERSPLVAVK
ncbi:unnamed protein product [Caenorhabditis angaria]|uniref:Uncharacterized protein n=1 Tax=Caenorhabditis angaria TaxID=860376 RepID=A0A9P1N512_9PELO|nr:unnamed protein product [Caenorhabditis angaria]